MKASSTTATIANGPGLSQSALGYIEGRGISGETASRLGIYSGNHAAIGPSIVFPFFEGGEVVNEKWRNRDKDMTQTAGGKQTFYNADAIDLAVDEGKFLLITEGEFDCVSAIEAGYPWAVSVPGGAPKYRSNDPIDVEADQKYKFVWDNWERLAKVRRVILAGDGDDKGQNLNHELQRRLGPERCLVVSYPDGCKDLNDVLQAHGNQGVLDCISRATPYPIKGLHELSDFKGDAVNTTYDIGFGREMDINLRVSLGMLMVVTGVPTHGKSHFVDTMLFNLARNHQWKSVVGTFEAPPVPYWRGAMRRRYLGRSDFAPEDAKRADEWLERHFFFIGQNTTDDEDLDLTVEEILDLCRVAVIRYGVKVVCLDPWNEIEHRRRRDENGTDYTGRALRQFKRFARLYNVLMVIVAHPRKPQQGNYTEPPSLYDIEGSSHWRNKPEIGVTVWRPDTRHNLCEIHVQKIKFRENGCHGVVSMKVDPDSGHYREVVSDA